MTWSTRLGPFVLEHDESKVLERWTRWLLLVTDPKEAARFRITETAEIEPLALRAMKSAKSEEAPGVQIADVLAGVCGYWLRGWLGGSADERFLAEVEASGVLRLIDHLLWPIDEPLAERLASWTQADPRR